MEGFEDIFLEEARELIQQLEEALLILEKDFQDLEQIKVVFRIMHSLKGGAGMFGMTQIERITHQLEDAYELVCSSSSVFSSQLLNVSLKVLDVLPSFLDDLKFEQESTKASYQVLIEELKLLEATEVEGIENKEDEEQVITIIEDPKEVKQTYLINFEPNLLFLQAGHNPLILLKELIESGTHLLYLNSDKVPNIDALDATQLYLSWDLLIATDLNENQIQEIFLFVEDDCNLQIKHISEEDWFEKNEVNPNDVELNSSQSLTDLIEQFKPKDEEVGNSTPVKTKSATNEATLRIAESKVNELMNLVSELITDQHALKLYCGNSNDPDLTYLLESLERNTIDLRDLALDMSLTQVDVIFVRFQRLVRDLSLQLNKEVEFSLEGGEIEVDKKIVDRLAEPLLHILRNCLDHGIESTEERIKNGKPAKGHIGLKVSRVSGMIHITISDDGKGIDANRIRTSALKKGIIEESEVFTEQQLVNLIFHQGFSTADVVSDISGRGVGMDIVRKSIQALKGQIGISTEIGKGTSFDIKLPLSLSTIDGLLVKVHNANLIIPISLIERSVMVYKKQISSNINNLIEVEGTQMPLIQLETELFEERANESIWSSKEFKVLIIVKLENKEYGLLVDESIGIMQGVLKPLGPFFDQRGLFSGATVMGDGSVTLVLDVGQLVELHT